MALMVQLPSTCSIVSAAFVDNSSGVKPAFPRNAESAIVKHPACAAAMSSSGLVPGAFSNRVVNEYGVSFRTPPGADNVPLPCFKSPVQMADAVRFIDYYSSPHVDFTAAGAVYQREITFQRSSL